MQERAVRWVGGAKGAAMRGPRGWAKRWAGRMPAQHASLCHAPTIDQIHRPCQGLLGVLQPESGRGSICWRWRSPCLLTTLLRCCCPVLLSLCCSEMQEREKQLSEELAQAQAGLDMLRRLHQASQNQLFRCRRRRGTESTNTCWRRACVALEMRLWRCVHGNLPPSPIPLDSPLLCSMQCPVLSNKEGPAGCQQQHLTIAAPPFCHLPASFAACSQRTRRRPPGCRASWSGPRKRWSAASRCVHAGWLVCPAALPRGAPREHPFSSSTQERSCAAPPASRSCTLCVLRRASKREK